MGATLALFDGMRAPTHALLQTWPDPHAELLALVWGPRFDREHAQHLLRHEQGVNKVQVWQALVAAADAFDHLPAPGQHRLRRLIVRHRGRLHSLVDGRSTGQWDNQHHAPHLAD